VALLVGYLIGAFHIDPCNITSRWSVSFRRYHDNVPDIDLDFPRSIREDLILRTHENGLGTRRADGHHRHYQIKGAVRDLGKALGLPQVEIDQLSKFVDWGSAGKLEDRWRSRPILKIR